MAFSDQQLVQQIRCGSINAFEALYKEYYAFLCLIAEQVVRNPADAEEIVSDVFIRLWKIRENLNITTSLKAYLVKAVYNTSVNYLAQNRKDVCSIEDLKETNLVLLSWESDYPIGQLYEKEITDMLEAGIANLPPACREVFLLSRDENLTYFDIAQKMGISVNTVKAQIKNALARLRILLKDYLKAIILLFFF